VKPSDGAPSTAPGAGAEGATATKPVVGPVGAPTSPAAQLKRFHGSVTLDPTRVGRDASRIADEVIAHLSGLVGAKVTVTLEVSGWRKTGTL
jgi:hypothetical protein